MSVLVVGGGITGLVATRELARAGVPVTLVEAADRLGGKVATERVDGFVVEHGPDSFLSTRPAAVALARELGLGGDLIGTTDPRCVYIRHEGRLVPMPAGLGLVLPTRALPFATTRLFSPLEKARMALDVVTPRLLGGEDVAVGAYLRRRLGNPLVDRLAGPLVGGVYGTPIDELSLDAVVPQLRTAEREHRSLLFAGLADGRAMRRAIAARPAGARSLGTFVSLAGGMDTLTNALARSLSDTGNVTVHTGLAVRSISRAGSGVVAALSDDTHRRFHAVVLTTPAPLAARVLERDLPAAARALELVPHGTSLLVTLGYRRDRVAHDLVGHGYLVPPDAGGAIGACTWTSEKWAGRAPEGTALFRLFVRDAPAWTRLSDAEAVAAARDDLAQTIGVEGDPELVRIARLPAAMPRYTVGHLGRVARIEAAIAAWPAVTVAGASYRGVGLPDCVAQGVAAARAVGTRVGVARTPDPVLVPA